ncbi:DUF192 domain-containing protein [Patescibacteria group bacterium]|nr:DUF192 domain-containing protein [Patescibacteria group bacterium]
MKKISILWFLFIFFVVGIYYWSDSDKSEENLPKAYIAGQAFDLEIASDNQSRRLGLAGRDFLADNQAMLFIFPEKSKPAFWMKGMKFDIDLLWIDNQTIVDYEKNMPAVANDFELRRYYPVLEVDKVMELPAGTIDSLGIKKGDIIKFSPR